MNPCSERMAASRSTVDLRSVCLEHPDELHWDESKRLGCGGYGTVYRGTYCGREVAVKLFNNTEFVTPEDQMMIEREVMILPECRHDAIVEFIGAVVNEEQKIVGIVTELCPYGSLKSALEMHPDVFDGEFKMKVLVDVSRAMMFLHRKDIIHRDLKPENVLIVSLDPRSPIVAKVSDFGTARHLTTEAKMTNKVGTEDFMAPEVLAGKEYGESADVYSFAILVLYMYQTTHMYQVSKKCEWKGLKKGYPLKAPCYCPQFVKDLMRSCWNLPSKRPSFEAIHNFCQRRLTIMMIPENSVDEDLSPKTGIELNVLRPQNEEDNDDGDWVLVEKDAVDDEVDQDEDEDGPWIIVEKQRNEPRPTKGIRCLLNTVVSRLFRGL